MRFDYWTVQFRPSPFSLTVYGIGVIAQDPNSHRSGYRKHTAQGLGVPKLHAQELALEVGDVLFESLDSVSTANATLEVAEGLDVASYLNRSVDLMNNSLVIEGPFSVEHDSLEDALELLHRAFVEPQKRVPKKRKLTVVRELLISEYRSKDSLEDKLALDPVLETADREKKLDFAVHQGSEIYEISSAFNFQVEDNSGLLNAADSWAYRISELRKEGGRLKVPEHDVIGVLADVPVVAVFYPPKTRTQKEVFSMCDTTWKRLGIEAVPFDGVSSHANELAARVPA